MRPETVFFSSAPGLYSVACLRCGRIDCDCTEVTFELNQISEDEEPVGTRISIRVDLPTWQESNPPQRSLDEAAIVTEFLQDYPPSERKLLMEWCDERDRIRQRLDTCRLDPSDVAGGYLISFREILASNNDGSWVCPLGEYDFEHEQGQYIVVERYCTNPDCECNQVHLSFMAVPSDPDPAGTVIKEQILALWSFGGDLSLRHFSGIDRSDAQRVVDDWYDEIEGDPEWRDLKWRYEKIREIGRRSIGSTRRGGESPPRVDAPAVQIINTLARPGRNEPCPCGSGKKYKKCCGRTTQTADEPI
jgi:hypothetical protein